VVEVALTPEDLLIAMQIEVHGHMRPKATHKQMHLASCCRSSFDIRMTWPACFRQNSATQDLATRPWSAIWVLEASSVVNQPAVGYTYTNRRPHSPQQANKQRNQAANLGGRSCGPQNLEQRHPRTALGKLAITSAS
jgi:hypothetical protein